MTMADYKAQWEADTARVADALAKFQVAANGYNAATRKAAFDDYLHALARRDERDRAAAANINR